MEPMNLGSPVGSPTAQTQIPPVSGTSSPFLPSFLMGDVASPAGSGSRIGGGGGASPNKTTRQYSTSTSVSSPGSPQPTKDPFFPARMGPDKPGGPPIQSLMGVRGPPSLPQSPIATRLGSPYVDQRILGTPISHCGPVGQITPGTPIHPANQSVYSNVAFTPGREQSSFLGHDTSLSTSLCDALEDSWVTVFGFPAAAASYILTQFTQLGTIVEHRNPGTGNWMHLKYQTKLQARKALSKNGKVFSGNIMVGVVPCSDKTITGDKENMSANLSNVLSPETSMVGTPKSNIRPLTQAYQTAHAEHEVVPKVNTPKKNDSIVSKAMQHIFGL